MKLTKRALVWMLAIVMIVSCLPLQFVGATEVDEAAQIAQTKEEMMNFQINVDGEPVDLEKVEKPNFSTVQTRSTVYEVESNNSMSLADRVYNGDMAYGSVSSSDLVDYYKFTLSSRSEVSLLALSSYYGLIAGVMNSSGDVLAVTMYWEYSDGYYWYILVDESYSLPILNSGTYYVIVIDENDSYNSYGFMIEWTAASSSHTHSYGAWEVYTAPTCDQNGENRRYCSCGAYESQTVNMLGHEYGQAGIITEATCTTDGETLMMCVNCDDSYTEWVPAYGHTVRNLLPEEATCTTDGLTGGSECATCGEVLEAQQVIPALGHEYEESTNSNGDIVYTCLNCGDTYTEGVLPDGDPVAVIGTKEYATVEAALKAAKSGDTVTLIADSNESGSHLVIDDGVTLNLATYDLTAKSVTGLSGSLLNAGRYGNADWGRLFVAENRLILSTDAVVNGSNRVITFWDPNDECYVLANMRIKHVEDPTFDEDNKVISFKFSYGAGSAANKDFLRDAKGADDNAMDIVVRLSWESENGVAYQDFVYKAEYVSALANSGGNFTFMLTGYDMLNINLDTFSITGIILCDCGIVVAGESYTAN